jgi:hypothetical protein
LHRDRRLPGHRALPQHVLACGGSAAQPHRKSLSLKAIAFNVMFLG